MHLQKCLSASLEAWSWQRVAACRGMDSSVFYSPPGETGRAKQRRERKAKRICGGCRVRVKCAEFALLHGERFGVWGGMGEKERCEILDTS